MIAAYHLIWTAYGWWLPNDPRGSTSHSIRTASIANLGDLHQGRKRIQPSGRTIREFYQAAAGLLRYSLLKFSDEEIAAMGGALRDTIQSRNYTCYGCAMMPDHCHLLIRRHRERPEAIIAALQDATRAAVRIAGRGDRESNHPIWGGPGWKVYLDTREHIESTIRYIRENPLKIGRREQYWDFVQPYHGWLPPQTKSMREIASERLRRDAKRRR